MSYLVSICVGIWLWKLCEALDRKHVRAVWRCRRCKQIVVDKRCECTESPSPWEPVICVTPLLERPKPPIIKE